MLLLESLALFPVTCLRIFYSYFQLFTSDFCDFLLLIFHFNKKLNLKREIPWCNWSVYFNVAKRNLDFDVDFDVEFDVAIFMVRGIWLRKDFWLESIWWATVQKQLLQSTLNFAHNFWVSSNSDLLIFIAIHWKILKPHFEWKQSKADYSKSI